MKAIDLNQIYIVSEEASLLKNEELYKLIKREKAISITIAIISIGITVYTFIKQNKKNEKEEQFIS